jgi:DNA-directed RNA polymerase specialized sigma24 family protein
MTWDDVYRDHWGPLVAWCRRVYGPWADPENIAQAALARVWRSHRAVALGWSGELVRWHLVRNARDYVSGRPWMFRTGRPLFPGDDRPGRVAAGVAEYLPDDLPADERAVVLAACDEGRSLSEIGGVRGKAWADRVWRRAVRRLQKSSQLARDFAGVN